MLEALCTVYGYHRYRVVACVLGVAAAVLLGNGVLDRVVLAVFFGALGLHLAPEWHPRRAPLEVDPLYAQVLQEREKYARRRRVEDRFEFLEGVLGFGAWLVPMAMLLVADIHPDNFAGLALLMTGFVGVWLLLALAGSTILNKVRSAFFRDETASSQDTHDRGSH